MVIKIFLFCLLLISAPAPLKAETPESRAQTVAEEMMSPYCPGRTLAACPSDDARKLRDEIGGWFASGSSDEQVRERLISVYGDGVLAGPSELRDRILAQGVIALAAVGGLFWVLSFLRRNREQSIPQADPAPEVTQRIEAELQQRLQGR